MAKLFLIILIILSVFGTSSYAGNNFSSCLPKKEISLKHTSLKVENGLLSLPFDCKNIVFMHLRIEDLKNVSLVCKDLKKTVTLIWGGLRKTLLGEKIEIPLTFALSPLKLDALLDLIDPLSPKKRKHMNKVISLVSSSPELRAQLCQSVNETRFTYRDFPILMLDSKEHSKLHRHLKSLYSLKGLTEFEEACRSFYQREDHGIYEQDKGRTIHRDYTRFKGQPLWGCYINSPKRWARCLFTTLVSELPDKEEFLSKKIKWFSLYDKTFPGEEKHFRRLKSSIEKIEEDYHGPSTIFGKVKAVIFSESTSEEPPRRLRYFPGSPSPLHQMERKIPSRLKP
ncbi:MAG: hypothetical protein JSR85_03205 [Proteobacteria bacterium]|nr:hypothetical protein [Pseudomonadota bacterium]